MQAEEVEVLLQLILNTLQYLTAIERAPGSISGYKMIFDIY